MSILTVNLLFSTLVFWVAARIYVLPRLHELKPRTILLPILLLHSFRHLGLMFLAPADENNGLIFESWHRIATSSMTLTTNGSRVLRRRCWSWFWLALPPGGWMSTSMPFSDGVKLRAVLSTAPRGQRLRPRNFGGHTTVGRRERGAKPSAGRPLSAFALGIRPQPKEGEVSDKLKPGPTRQWSTPSLGLLAAKSVGSEGSFSKVTSIQRVSTVGGVAARINYTADYYFFTAK